MWSSEWFYKRLVVSAAWPVLPRAAHEAALPEPMSQVLADYERHLVAERDLTPHTVRAYLADQVRRLFSMRSDVVVVFSRFSVTCS